MKELDAKKLTCPFIESSDNISWGCNGSKNITCITIQCMAWVVDDKDKKDGCCRRLR